MVISGEDLQPFHPANGHLQHTDPLGAAHATAPDTRRWVEMLIAEGRRRGVHLVIDSTLSRPEVFAHRAEALRTAGYRVEAHALAVSPEWSWQGVHQRRERLIALVRTVHCCQKAAGESGSAPSERTDLWMTITPRWRSIRL